MVLGLGFGVSGFHDSGGAESALLDPRNEETWTTTRP